MTGLPESAHAAKWVWLDVPQRRREQDRPLDSRVQAVHERQIRPERPAHQPDVRQVVELGVLDRGSDVEPLPHSIVERSLTGSLNAGRATRVEPQDGDSGEGRQPIGRLAEEVAVHHPAMGRQRMQADHRGDGIASPAGRSQRASGRCPHHGRASSPMSFSPSAVSNVMGSRRAGRTEFPRMGSGISSSSPSKRCASDAALPEHPCSTGPSRPATQPCAAWPSGSVGCSRGRCTPWSMRRR